MLALVAIPLVPPAAGDVSGYAHPLNAGGKDPFGVIPDVEEDAITFHAGHAFSQFTVETHDYLGLDTWMRVCVRVSGGCMGNAQGAERVTVTAPTGVTWALGTPVDVYVYSAHVWADGETNVGTWGGIRGRFSPDAQVDDVVPYVAAGYGGVLPYGIPVDIRFRCGNYVGAQCATIPFAAKSIRVSLIDDVVDDIHFEACVTTPSGGEVRCVPATRTGTLVAPNPGGFTPGDRVDIRPYVTIQNKLVGTKGFAVIQYSP